MESVGDGSGWKEELLWAKRKAGMEDRKEVEGPLPKSQPGVSAAGERFFRAGESQD